MTRMQANGEENINIFEEEVKKWHGVGDLQVIKIIIIRYYCREDS